MINIASYAVCYVGSGLLIYASSETILFDTVHGFKTTPLSVLFVYLHTQSPEYQQPGLGAKRAGALDELADTVGRS